MNIPNRLREWLQVAFTEHVGLMNENYYFDRTTNEFYSVFITDYFLTDPNSNDDYPDAPYTTDELIVLSARIDRQENGDPSIISIPRLTIKERKQMMEWFLEDQHLEDLSLHNLVNTENGRTDLNFDKLLPTELEEQWQYFKWEFVQNEIDSFCNLQNIRLETVSLWTDKKMTSLTLDVNKETEVRDGTSKQEITMTKPWWKFW